MNSSNRPTQRFLSDSFNQNGFAYICLDFHGHGYSDGLKGAINVYAHLHIFSS
jgi:alpha-beta hydrolase superfamily lysophospholipase